MKLNHAYPRSGLIGTVISLAHATFYDALPSNADHRAAVAPAHPLPPKRAGFIDRSFAAVDGWFYRQRQKERESYLAQSSDLADLERRVRMLERHPYY